MQYMQILCNAADTVYVRLFLSLKCVCVCSNETAWFQQSLRCLRQKSPVGRRSVCLQCRRLWGSLCSWELWLSRCVCKNRECGKVYITVIYIWIYIETSRRSTMPETDISWRNRNISKRCSHFFSKNSTENNVEVIDDQFLCIVYAALPRYRQRISFQMFVMCRSIDSLIGCKTIDDERRVVSEDRRDSTISHASNLLSGSGMAPECCKVFT